MGKPMVSCRFSLKPIHQINGWPLIIIDPWIPGLAALGGAAVERQRQGGPAPPSGALGRLGGGGGGGDEKWGDTWVKP